MIFFVFFLLNFAFSIMIGFCLKIYDSYKENIFKKKEKENRDLTEKIHCKREKHWSFSGIGIGRS
jgi:hypothetical protein